MTRTSSAARPADPTPGRAAAPDLPWTSAELGAQEVRDRLGDDHVLMPHGPICNRLIERKHQGGDPAQYDPTVLPYCDRFIDMYGLTWLCDMDAGHGGRCVNNEASQYAVFRERIGGRA